METVPAQLIGGLVGGAAGGKTVKGSNLSDVGNLIIGAVGGVAGGSRLGAEGAAGGVESLRLRVSWLAEGLLVLSCRSRPD